MTTWSLAQVRSVSKLFASVEILEWDLERDGVRDAARADLVEHLARLAHSHAVEIDDRDVVFREQPIEDRKFHVEMIGHWAPPTKEIELRGGERDGERLVWQQHPSPIKVARQSSTPLDAYADPTSPYPLDHHTYEMSGWSELDRVWIYTS